MNVCFVGEVLSLSFLSFFYRVVTKDRFTLHGIITSTLGVQGNSTNVQLATHTKVDKKKLSLSLSLGLYRINIIARSFYLSPGFFYITSSLPSSSSSSPLRAEPIVERFDYQNFACKYSLFWVP